MKTIFIRTIIPALALLGAAQIASAQDDSNKAQVSASLESNSIYYINDKALGDAPEDRFGSNNYAKVDFTKGRFSAGIQLEGYLPALYGFEVASQTDYKKFFLGSKYIQWVDDAFEVRIGNIYDQFGNGLILRSYEDRQLGFDNSLEGIRAIYRANNFLTLKAVYGRPRFLTEYCGSWVRGADLSISLADIFGWNAVGLAIEGSYLNRYERLDKDANLDFGHSYELDTPQLNMFSGRLDFNWNGLTLRGEYAKKSKDLYNKVYTAADGYAIYAEAIYSYKTLSLSATWRMLDKMGTPLSIYVDNTFTANALNYLPALTRQHTYMLANLHPYIVMTEGENAGQFDAYYTLRSRTTRQRYWNFHLNWSGAWTKENVNPEINGPSMLWCDINFDVERQWSKNLKTIFLYSRQEMNPNHGIVPDTYASDIFVADVTYKFNKKMSLRCELQYLLCETDESRWESGNCEGDWVAALVEFSVAPRWSVYAQDMYNLGLTKVHYYTGGVSYTKGRTRVQLSYGRNRAGYVCSGGVCRETPAYTGANLSFTTSF